MYIYIFVSIYMYIYIYIYLYIHMKTHHTPVISHTFNPMAKYPPAPMNHKKIFKGRSRQYVSWELVPDNST